MKTYHVTWLWCAITRAHYQVVAEQDPDDGTWSVGWPWDNGDHVPHFVGYATRQEPKPTFPASRKTVAREAEARREEIVAKQEKAAEERARNARRH